MRRILLLVTVAAMMAVMMVAGAASATVHPQMNSERSGSNPPAHTPAATQDPPGISGQSNADNFAQPIVAQLSNPTSNDCSAWKEGQQFCQ